MAQPYNFDQKKKQNQQPAMIGSQGQASIVPTTQQAQAGSGRFQNLQKFIGANQEAPQQYEQKISGKIGGQAKEIQEDTKARLETAKNIQNQENQRLTQGQQIISQIPQNAVNIANQAEQAAQIDAIRNQQFNRGINLGDTMGLQRGIADVEQNVGLTKSEEGRKQLLRNVYGQNDPQKYGVGASRLDQLLLQADPTSAGRLKSLAEQSLAGTTQTFEQAQQQAQQAQQEIAGQAQTAAQLLQQTLDKSLGDLRSGVEGRVGDFQSNLNKQIQIVNDALKQGSISRQVYDQLDPDFQNQLSNQHCPKISGLIQ